MEKILIVEDDDSIRNLIAMTLAMEHYETVEADNGETALEFIQTEKFDLLLLDIMLPKMDGYQLLQKVKVKNIPTIFLSAKINLQDKVFGLKLGADDYITKPFEPMELLARIESVLRRSRKISVEQEKTSDSNTIVYDDLCIHVDERIVTKDNIVIPLTVKEYELLVYFLNHLNLPLTREQLLDQIWGYDYYGGTRTVDMHVKELRKKLDLKNKLETVFKVGYKLKGINER